MTPETRPAADSAPKEAPSVSSTSVISATLFRNTLWAVAACIFSGAVIDHMQADADLPMQLSVGRVIASLVIAISGFLAHQKHINAAFAVLSAIYLLGLFNAAFIAGFGISSPALMTGLVPVLFALSMFERRRAFLWCLPTFAGWLGVAVVQVYDPSLFIVLSSAPTGSQPQATPTAWIMACLSTILPSILVTFSSRHHLERALHIEHNLRTEAELLLEQQSKWNRERDEFMGHVSHELRTPLAAMHNALTLARHPKASETVREKSLTTLDVSIGNMRSLLDDVLDAFKYGSVGFNIRQSEFSPTALLLEIDALFSELARQKGLTLVVECDANSNTLLIGDPSRIKQMLSNLVLNAIKFTQSGFVLVRLNRIDALDATWRFEVCDTGPGIAHEDQQRLFKPFTQLTNPFADANTGAGTGLGLSIVAQLTYAMGGRAGLTSELGQGSIFYFEIPLPSVSKSHVSAMAA